MTTAVFTIVRCRPNVIAYLCQELLGLWVAVNGLGYINGR